MESDKVKLITLLNVSSAQPRNLKRPLDPNTDWHAIAKKARSKPVLAESVTPASEIAPAPAGQDEQDDHEDATDCYKYHFATENTLLSTSTVAAVEANSWTRSSKVLPALGKVAELSPTRLDAGTERKLEPKINAKLTQKLAKLVHSKSKDQAKLTDDILDIVSSYRDFIDTRVNLEEHNAVRATLAMHAISHVLKTRTRVIRNNERLAKAEAGESEEKGTLDAEDHVETRDQGFTRPKVLILLPFRNSATTWLELLTKLSLAESVENRARFDKDFSLPEGTADRLAEPDAATKYPADHIATFTGNIDDSFRLGLKMNRKTIRCYSEFYASDIILASPLGLRMSIEKDDDSDFLSSVEVVVVDQADVLAMQNWEHLQFVFKHLNLIPKDAHGADFARIKPWYLDGKAANLRQTVLLSAYDTPEISSLVSRYFKNVSGRTHTTHTAASLPGVLRHIPRGVRQTFVKVDAASPQDEDEARFAFFKENTLPSLFRSAVASSGHTLIFVPSYFDFLRVEAHLKTIEDLEFACISEYSSNSDIARARNAFLKGQLPFLVMTERFHFFRRYRIRGARTLVFYALPDHAMFYQEMMTLPFETFGKANNEVPDESEVTSQVLFTRFDLFKLERVVGKQAAKRLLKSDESETRFTFS